MKNVLKATLGALLFSGLFFFNLNDGSSSENLSTMSLEQTTAYAAVLSEGAKDPHSAIGEATLCYNQVDLACDTNGGGDSDL